MTMRETKKSQKNSPISSQLASSGANAAEASPQVPAASPINRQPKTPKSSDSGAPDTPNSSTNKAEWPPQVPTPNGADKLDHQVRSVKSESGFFSDMPPPTPERCSSASIAMTSQPNTPGVAQQSSRRSPASAISAATAQQNQITIPNSPSLVKLEDPMDKLAQMTSSLGSGNSFGSMSQRSPAAISAPNTPGYNAPNSMQCLHGAPSPAGSLHGAFPGHLPPQQHQMMPQQMPQHQPPIIDRAQQIPDQPYMQQQSLVYVYTTAQANEAADMLSKGLIRKIGEYHTNQRASAKKFVSQFYQEQMQQQQLIGHNGPPQGWDPSMMQSDHSAMMAQMENAPGQPRMPMRLAQQFPPNGGPPGQMYGIPPNEGIPGMNGQSHNMAAAAANQAQLVRQRKLEELHSMERQLLPDNSNMSLVPDETSQLQVRPPPPYSNATGRSAGRITTTTVGRKRTHTQLQQGEFVQQTNVGMGNMPQMVSQEAHFTRTQDVDSMIKTETTFMPVPSPQPIQYVGTHLDQEVTIQKQPNRNFIRAPTGNVRQPGMHMHPRYGGLGTMTPQSMMAMSQQQQDFAASQQNAAEASRSQAIYHAQQAQMEANMRAQQFHGGAMPNGPPTTMGPQTVNNTYVNAKIAIEHVNIQNLPSGTYSEQYGGPPALISQQSDMYGAPPGQVQSGPSHAQMMHHQAHMNMLQQQQQQQHQETNFQQQQIQMQQQHQQSNQQIYETSPQIHIKPTQPNTIQYLPTTRPPLKSGPRPPPNLDFLQPWTGSGPTRGQLQPSQLRQASQQLPPGAYGRVQQNAGFPGQSGQMPGQFSHMNLSDGGDPSGMVGYAGYGPPLPQTQQSQQQHQQQQMAAQQMPNDPQYAAQFQQFQQRLYATNVAQPGQSS